MMEPVLVPPDQIEIIAQDQGWFLVSLPEDPLDARQKPERDKPSNPAPVQGEESFGTGLLKSFR